MNTNPSESPGQGIDSLRRELDGCLDLGMTAEVRKLVRAVLRHPDLNANGFTDAISAIGMDDRMRLWRRLVEAAYKRLPKKEQRRAAETMLAFYSSIKDTKSALRFCNARDLTTAPHLWFAMEVLLEYGKLKEAAAVARKCKELGNTAEEPFDVACLADALSFYYLRRRDFERAYALAYAAPASTLLPRSSTLAVTEFHLVAAVSALKNRLSALNELKRQPPMSLTLSLPGIEEEIINENEETLLRLKRRLENLIPKSRRNILGISSSRK